MTAHRHDGAPRLIEWTGERCVPWAPDVQVVYEHLHRYLWAAALLDGRRVLDLASGEGFGAAILSESAAEVVGVDIDPKSVEHATLNYERPNLSFRVGDARDLSEFDDGSFGAVVAFEMIEHVEPQARVVEEIKRVLAPKGLLIVSTPDRDAYGQFSSPNPYHLHELSRAEFSEMLAARFKHSAMFGQQTVTGSALARLEPVAPEIETSRSFFIERVGDDWRAVAGLPDVYLVAVASDHELPPLAPRSTLADAGIELVRAAERATAEAREALQRRYELQSMDLRASADDNARLQARVAQDAHTISSLDAALNATNRRLKRFEGSVMWQLFQRMRGRVFALLGGEDSAAVESLQRTLRYVGRRLEPEPADSGRSERGASRLVGPRSRRGLIELPTSNEPTVSLVIPMYAHAELTRAALESIRDYTEQVSYEVILVDDAADAATKALLAEVRGARILVNEVNVGYQRSVHRGADAARGKWLVLCNNDIVVQPGWLSALLDCGESASDVAIVTPKYVYPDGSLSEAGGIIWCDGTGCNYGRGQDPDGCHFAYRREVDYGSAAALLVKAEFWHQVGGFDECFEPMYYEDTDLSFQARARGQRAMFEPRSWVIHVEGATAGVDETVGHKRYQERNRPRFVDKWRDRLEAEHLPASSDPWLGATQRQRHRVLVIDHRMPMWDRESGALRMRGMLEALLELDCHVSFLPDNTLPMEPYTRELQRIGVEVLYGPELPDVFDRIAPGLSLAILSRPQVAASWISRVREKAPEALLVYDTVDLHWLREARQEATGVSADGAELVITPKVKTMRELELGLIRASDATLVVTETERQFVLGDVPGAVLHIVPNVNPVRAPVPGWDQRAGVLFVGGFEHPPNKDAAVALVRDVMPRVWRELGHVPVTIVGSDPPDEVAELAGPQVRVAGWVPDLDPLLDSARALVAPLTFGAGLKGKVTQALAAGLPVVTTAIGAEGLDAVDGEQLLIGHDSDGLAERVIRVITDAGLWGDLSRAGQQLAAERCSPEVLTERLREVLGQAHGIPIRKLAARGV